MTALIYLCINYYYYYYYYFIEIRRRKTLYTGTWTKSDKIKSVLKKISKALTIACTKINRSNFTCNEKLTSLKHKSFVSI